MTFRFRWLGTSSTSDWTSSNAVASFSVAAGSTSSKGMTLTFTLDCDGTEGSETIALQVYVNPYNNTSNTEQILCTSPTVTITNGTPPTGVTFASPPTSINEGSTGAFRIIGEACVTSGTASLVAYGTGFSSADASLQSTSWTLTNGFALIYVDATADSVSDPNEQFRIELTYTAAGQTFTVYSPPVTIVDVSTPTYSISADQASVTEGSTATFTVTTTNVANGTVLTWQAGYGTASSSDISSTSGSVTINNNTGTISVGAVTDSLTEGGETFHVKLYSGSTLVATSGNVTILDPGGGSGSCTDGQCSWEWSIDAWAYGGGDCPGIQNSGGWGTEPCGCFPPSYSGTAGELATTNCLENPLP